VSQAKFGNAFPRTSHRLITLAVASACASMMVPAFAQENPQSPTTDVGQPQAAAPAQTVVVTGIRASMQSTLNLKRNSDGIVDGIVADDIGKFPDTNLAEAVQRISGVSIDRSNGEGQRVTIRGVDPNLNLILLNGRQMPTTNLDDRGSRAFDFSNLASEAISQIQVYKTTRADTPAGGIGATLNIMTGRPLDLGNQTSVGGKMVYDQSNTNLPHELKGKNITPEVSALISRKFGTDDMFGVALTASYQKRNSGFARATVPNGYLGPYNGTSDTSDRATIDKNSTGYTNVGATQLYDTPQNLSYTLNGTQRKRTNAQLTFQFRPTRDWTSTLDYTYAQNKRQVLENSLNAWFSGHEKITGANFVNGPVQTPTAYTETYNTPQDFAMVGNWSGTKTDLKSTGFNSQFRVNPDLKLSIDLHHSTATSGSDSPYGTASNLSAASFGRNSNSIYLDQEMPVFQMNYTPGPFQVNGSWFQDAALKQTVDQVQAGGSLKIGERSNLNFGAGAVKTKLKSSYFQNQNNAWTGTVAESARAQAGQFYNQSNFTPIDYRSYFSKLGGSDDPRMFPTMWLMNLPGVRADAIKFVTSGNPLVNTDSQKTYSAGLFGPSLAAPDEIRDLKEKTNSLHAQFNTEWDFAMPMHTGIGLRYEKTKVDTTYAIKNPVFISWSSQNELNVKRADVATTESQSSDYHYWLPSVDWDMDVTSNLKVRASFGTSIGRPQWNLIQGGTTFSGGTANQQGFNGDAGNPALKPVKSRNLDASAEWYYTKQSMVSLGLFHKDLTGYAGRAQVIVPSTTAKTPIGSDPYKAAVAACGGSGTFCVRNYILNNYNGQPGVSKSGTTAAGEATGTITSDIAGAPALPLVLSTSANLNKSNIKGAEINWQHMFDNGFGFQANYTYVKSSLTYNNAAGSLINGVAQFAMQGLANSANLVGIYENQDASVRLAYNWRGEFLYTTQANNQPQPGYTEPYGQVDLSVGYNLNKNLSLSLEAINLTNATQRQHGRTNNEILQTTQFGRRFMLGARYKF
jgi:TonB-dependent receptor